MPNHQFTPEQIAATLEAGRLLESQLVPVSRLCRELGIAELTYLRWQKKYTAFGEAAAARVRILEEENARLRRVVSGLGQVLEDLKSELGTDQATPPRLGGPLRAVSVDADDMAQRVSPTG